MTALRGLAWLLAFQSLGELLALRLATVREPVAACANFLLCHLSRLTATLVVYALAHAA